MTAWSSPRTWVAGAILTASQLNTHVRDNLLYLADTAGRMNPTADDHYFGAYAQGAGTGVSRLHVQTTAGAVLLKAEGDGANRDIGYRTKGLGTHAFQDGSGNNLALIDAIGKLFAVGSDHYFGAYAYTTGSGVSRLRVNAAAGGVYLIAEGDGADRDQHYRIKGSGAHYFEDDGGTALLKVDYKSHLTGGGAAPTVSALDANFSSSSVSGTDTAGTVTVTAAGGTASLPAGSIVCHITFANAYAATPHVRVSAANATAAIRYAAAASNVTTTGFDINTGPVVNTPLATAAHIFGWHVIA